MKTISFQLQKKSKPSVWIFFGAETKAMVNFASQVNGE